MPSFFLYPSRGMLEAALERDTNRMITTAVRGLDLVIVPALSDETDPKERKRALRFLAGVIQYVTPYEPPSGDSTKPSDSEFHDQRTKILESLTADMTDRSGREGDWIASFGGHSPSLRGRACPSSAAAATPFTTARSPSRSASDSRRCRESGVGWHFELGVLDLAQYLSFQAQPSDTSGTDKSIVVRKPLAQDVISPSIKIGAQWGREIPMFIAGAVGYAPFYEFKKSDNTVDSHGALTLSLALSAYVPLLDSTERATSESW